MNNFQLKLLELMIMFFTAIVTIITYPPLPLLAIPFLVIITSRVVFDILMSANLGEEKKNA